MEKVLVEILTKVCENRNSRNWRGFEICCKEYKKIYKNSIPMLNQTLISIKNRIRRFSIGPLKALFETNHAINVKDLIVIILYYKTLEKNKTMIGLRANDAGIALTYGMLAAESLGLGTCWIGMLQGAIPMNREILNILGIKGHVLGAFTLGFPAVKYRRTVPRPPLKIKGLE